MTAPRVQFIHGLEGSPRGAKATLLAAHFIAETPAMHTGDFESCVRLQAKRLLSFNPDVLVGSSFGGAVAVELLERGLWLGPTLLLAQAALTRNENARLPESVDVWLVHGTRDDVVPVEHSRTLARTGTPGRVRLIEVDEDHGLYGMVQSQALLSVVRDLYETSRR